MGSAGLGCVGIFAGVVFGGDATDVVVVGFTGRVWIAGLSGFGFRFGFNTCGFGRGAARGVKVGVTVRGDEGCGAARGVFLDGLGALCTGAAGRARGAAGGASGRPSPIVAAAAGPPSDATAATVATRTKHAARIESLSSLSVT